MDTDSVKVLHIEDSEEESLETLEVLLDAGYELDYRRVDTRDDVRNALGDQVWDIILCDYRLRGWNGSEAITMIRGVDAEVPILMLSGVLSEESAVNSLKLGAQDFIHKDNLSRFLPAVQRELEELEIRRSRKKSEEELHALEKETLKIFDILPSGVLVVDEERRIRKWNREAERITGISAEEAIGQSCPEIWGETCGGNCLFNRNSEFPLHGEICRFKRGNTTLVLQKNLDVIKDDDGHVIGGIEVFTDITKELGLESELEFNLLKYRQLVESLGEGIGEIDVDGNFTYMNKAGREIFGFEADTNLSQFNLRKLLDKTGLDRLRTMWEDLGSLGQSRFEIRIQFANGRYRDLLVTANRLEDPGEKLAGATGIFRDVTEQQKQQDLIKLQASELTKRMHELDCLYSISRIIEIPDLDLSDVLKKTIELLPDGFTHPDDLRVQIEFEGMIYGDAELPTNASPLVENLQVAGKKAGEFRVAYTPSGDNGQITSQARELLKVVVETTGQTISRIKMQNELEDSARFFRTLLNTIPFPVFYKNLDGFYLGCNEAFAEQAFGVPIDQIIGKTMFDFPVDVPEEEAERYREIEKKIIATGKTEYFESSLTPRNDQRRDFLFTKALFHNSKGEKVGLVGVMVNITRRLEVEETLLHRLDLERTLSTLTSEYVSSDDSASTITNTLNSLGMFAAANHVIHFRILDEQKIEVEEVLLDSTQPQISKLGVQIEKKRLKAFLDLLGRQEVLELSGTDYHNLQSPSRGKKKHKDDKQILVFPYRNGESITGWVEFHEPQNLGADKTGDNKLLFVSSITIIGNMIERERREAELRMLRTAIEESADAITIMEISGTIIYTNAAFEKVYGYTREEVIGKSFYVVMGDEHPKSFYDDAIALISSGEVWQATLKNRGKDGSDTYKQLTVSPIMGEGDVVTHMVAIGRDITKTLELEAQLRQAQKLESIGQLAAGIAHEINTPVQYMGDNTQFLLDNINSLFEIITGYEEALEQLKTGVPLESISEHLKEKSSELDLDYLRQEIPEAMSQSLEGVERVAKIVQAMKEFSHPGQEDKQPIDLEKALKSTAIVARNVWKYVADLNIDVQPDLPLVRGYPAELNQVFLNMIVNSTHAIEERLGEKTEQRGTIEITARAEGDKVEIHVKDDGAGIPESIKQRIYDPFFTTKSVGKGTGQGLAIAYHVIVEKHKGAIDFTSQPGVGTEFVIQLPAVSE